MEIKQGFRNDRSSLHILHDVATERPEYVKFNSHDAIAWDDLVNGIESGRYPRIAAITAPAFGLEEFKDGAILSPDKAIRDMAHRLD
ncbi:MAG: hypothetical protein NT135_01245 [Candidatus Berkelbacteria bacterium]|nr:hypothetical protein [Candidatus Berkelbacteria bacterium]